MYDGHLEEARGFDLTEKKKERKEDAMLAGNAAKESTELTSMRVFATWRAAVTFALNASGEKDSIFL